jgi:hypothetical protein
MQPIFSKEEVLRTPFLATKKMAVLERCIGRETKVRVDYQQVAKVDPARRARPTQPRVPGKSRLADESSRESGFS